MPIPEPDQGFPAACGHDNPDPDLHLNEVPCPLADDRGADYLEAESVKYNVARVVRLSSGRFALFSHYRASALDLIKVGTIEEIAPHIPSADECGFTAEPAPRTTVKRTASDLLADIGL